MALSHWRKHQAPETALYNPGSASYCWEQSLRRSPTFATQKGNLCSFPMNGHAPLGISLLAPDDFGKRIESSPFSSRHLIDGLLREIEQAAATHRQRQVPWLNWGLPQNLLDSADVTELIYYLSRRFNLGEVENRRYNVIFKADDISESRAALFKGLGFNSLEVRLNTADTFPAKQLAHAMTMAKDFHYSLFGICLSSLDTELIPGLQSLFALGYRPDSICVAPFVRSEENSRQFRNLFTFLRDHGFRVLGNDCFIDKIHPLAEAQSRHTLKLTSHGYNCQNVSDILGLGPGNYSSSGDNRYYNPVELQDYLRHNFTDRKTSSFACHSLKAVFDHLLCYHHLDLKYFRDRYDWDLLKLLQPLWAPFQRGQPSLYSLCNSGLSLSPEGILNLSILCESLMEKLGDTIPPLPAQSCVGK